MIMLKDATRKQMRLRVTGYYQGEYMYILAKNGLILNRKIKKGRLILSGKKTQKGGFFPLFKLATTVLPLVLKAILGKGKTRRERNVRRGRRYLKRIRGIQNEKIISY